MPPKRCRHLSPIRFPKDPPLQIQEELAGLHTDAVTALSRLEIAGGIIPSTNWLLYGFVRKKAVTQITSRPSLDLGVLTIADHSDGLDALGLIGNPLTHID